MLAVSPVFRPALAGMSKAKSSSDWPCNEMQVRRRGVQGNGGECHGDDKQPISRQSRVISNVMASVRVITGTMGVSVSMSEPTRKPCR